MAVAWLHCCVASLRCYMVMAYAYPYPYSYSFLFLHLNHFSPKTNKLFPERPEAAKPGVRHGRERGKAARRIIASFYLGLKH